MHPLHKLALYYLLSYGASGAFFPLLPLLLAGRGLGDTEISWVMALNPAFTLFVPPIWAMIADALRARVLMLRLTAFGCAAATLAFIPAPGVVTLMAAMALLCVFRTPIPSLIDAATYAALGSDSRGYARVRLWGSVGFAACVGASGWIDGARRPELLLTFVAVLFAGSGLVALAIDGGPPRVRPRAVFSRAIAYLGTAGLVPLFATNSLYYAAHTTFDTYFGLYCEHLHLPPSVASTGWTLAVFSEVAVMTVAPRIIAARSPWTLILFTAAVSAVRWALISVVTSPGPMIALQALHGITFGLWYLALLEEVQSRVPEELRTSVQGVMLATLGVGALIGVLVAGPILEGSSGAVLFRLAAAAAALSLGCYALQARRAAA